jgi:hypothetical protein
MPPAFNAETIKRACQIKQVIEACGHPSLKFRTPSEGCAGCIISSHNGGHAIDLPDQRKQTPAPTTTQS